MTVFTVAGGILIALLPYLLIRGGCKVLRQDEFQWIGTSDKAIGFVLILSGVILAIVIMGAALE